MALTPQLGSMVVLPPPPVGRPLVFASSAPFLERAADAVGTQSVDEHRIGVEAAVADELGRDTLQVATGHLQALGVPLDGDLAGPAWPISWATATSVMGLDIRL